MPFASRVARMSLLAAFLAHVAEIGSRGVAGLHPLSSLSEAIGFLAFLMVGSFLYDAKTGSFEQRMGGAAPGRHADQARAELERLRLTATGWRRAAE